MPFCYRGQNPHIKSEAHRDSIEQILHVLYLNLEIRNGSRKMQEESQCQWIR
jgi:hypothetical protein